MMQEMQYKFAMIMSEISLMGYCELCKNTAPSAHFFNNWALNPQPRKVHFFELIVQRASASGPGLF